MKDQILKLMEEIRNSKYIDKQRCNEIHKMIKYECLQAKCAELTSATRKQQFNIFTDWEDFSKQD